MEERRQGKPSPARRGYNGTIAFLWRHTPSRVGKRGSDLRRYWVLRLEIVALVLALSTFGGYFGGRLAYRSALKVSNRCPGGFQVTIGKVKFCTHGPDKTGGNLFAEAGAQAGPGAVFCYGDGQSGPRVEGIYLHAADIADRYSSLLGTLRAYAVAVDNIYATSAQETGGLRHIRFAVDPGTCNMTIHDVQVSAAGDDSFGATIQELQAQGYNRTDRKYMIWADAKVYCGIGSLASDDQPGPQNANNNGPSYGRTDSSCWGGGAESHELMHNLGGVQLSAAHSTGAYHCNDGADRECYNDGGPHGAQTAPCPTAHAQLFDCNHDDYYSTSPAGYLVDHWNAANSVYLEQQPGSTSPNPTPPPTTTTSSSTTTTFHVTTTTRPKPTPTPTTTCSHLGWIKYNCHG